MFLIVYAKQCRIKLNSCISEIKQGEKMSENLNNAEKEFFEIFKHYKTITNNSISLNDVYTAQLAHQYMSSSNYKNLEDILKSLESKGFVRMEDNEHIFLTQLGEDYLWRS